jgi:hypothetical protein
VKKQSTDGTKRKKENNMYREDAQARHKVAKDLDGNYQALSVLRDKIFKNYREGKISTYEMAMAFDMVHNTASPLQDAYKMTPAEITDCMAIFTK